MGGPSQTELRKEEAPKEKEKLSLYDTEILQPFDFPQRAKSSVRAAVDLGGIVVYARPLNFNSHYIVDGQNLVSGGCAKKTDVSIEPLSQEACTMAELVQLPLPSIENPTPLPVKKFRVVVPQSEVSYDNRVLPSGLRAGAGGELVGLVRSFDEVSAPQATLNGAYNDGLITWRAYGAQAPQISRYRAATATDVSLRIEEPLGFSNGQLFANISLFRIGARVPLNGAALFRVGGGYSLVHPTEVEVNGQKFSEFSGNAATPDLSYFALQMSNPNATFSEHISNRNFVVSQRAGNSFNTHVLQDKVELGTLADKVGAPSTSRDQVFAPLRVGSIAVSPDGAITVGTSRKVYFDAPSGFREIEVGGYTVRNSDGTSRSEVVPDVGQTGFDPEKVRVIPKLPTVTSTKLMFGNATPIDKITFRGSPIVDSYVADSGYIYREGDKQAFSILSVIRALKNSSLPEASGTETLQFTSVKVVGDDLLLEGTHYPDVEWNLSARRLGLSGVEEYPFISRISVAKINQYLDFLEVVV